MSSRRPNHLRNERSKLALTIRLFSAVFFITPLWILPVADQNTVTLRLTTGDDGKSFNLSLGDKIEVELISASGTGYNWICTQQPAPLLKIEGVKREQVERALGGQQKQIHTFSTDSPGKVQITCNLVRPWERDSKPAQTVKIDLEVEPQ